MGTAEANFQVQGEPLQCSQKKRKDATKTYFGPYAVFGNFETEADEVDTLNTNFSQNWVSGLN